MMREYLFRGNKTSNGEWVYGDLWCTLYGGRRVFIVSPINIQDIMGVNEVNLETIGQYTGMLDKNGTKIFEGDIIDFFGRSDGDGYGVVKYDAYETEFGFEYDNIYRSLGKNFYPENIEVVGNIYDNPELLGDEENDKRKNR